MKLWEIPHIENAEYTDDMDKLWTYRNGKIHSNGLSIVIFSSREDYQLTSLVQHNYHPVANTFDIEALQSSYDELVAQEQDLREKMMAYEILLEQLTV
jgi:hypothetical protein